LYRVIKVAKKYEGRGVTFAVSGVDDFQHELNEFGLTHTDKPVVAARNDKDEKFPMQTNFRLVGCSVCESCVTVVIPLNEVD